MHNKDRNRKIQILSYYNRYLNMSHITTLNEIINQCLEPDKILGATDSDGSMKFIMKWKNAEPSMISGQDAKELFPYIVIEFYESKLIWQSANE